MRFWQISVVLPHRKIYVSLQYTKYAKIQEVAEEKWPDCAAKQRADDCAISVAWRNHITEPMLGLFSARYSGFTRVCWRE